MQHNWKYKEVLFCQKRMKSYPLINRIRTDKTLGLDNMFSDTNKQRKIDDFIVTNYGIKLKSPNWFFYKKSDIKKF